MTTDLKRILLIAGLVVSTGTLFALAGPWLGPPPQAGVGPGSTSTSLNQVTTTAPTSTTMAVTTSIQATTTSDPTTTSSTTPPTSSTTTASTTTTTTTIASTTTTAPPTTTSTTTPAWPPPGNPAGNAPVPAEARAVNTSNPNHVIGNGTPASCTSEAVVAAVAQGGIIVFNCGPDPVTIPMHATARVFNNRPNVVIDGGGKVTLDGQGSRRILYMNTCDQSLVWTTSHCQNQDHPTLTVQNLTFVNGRSSGTATMDGGGAIFVRGGRFKVVNSRFFGNRCAGTGPDVGGAAIQVFSQYEGRPVYVVQSTFGGSGSLRNQCSNGGATSSIGVSWTMLNSLFVNNRAIGNGANPPKPGTPGGGNGGAIYLDGNEMTLRLDGTRVEGNHAPEGGSAIFFVSNNRSGDVFIANSVLRNNTGDSFWTHPGIFFLGRNISFTNSVVE